MQIMMFSRQQYFLFHIHFNIAKNKCGVLHTSGYRSGHDGWGGDWGLLILNNEQRQEISNICVFKSEKRLFRRLISIQKKIKYPFIYILMYNRFILIILIILINIYFMH